MILRASVPGVMALGYLAWRRYLGASGPGFGEDGPFALGTNVVENLAQLALAAVVPISTTDLFTALRLEQRAVVLLGLLGSILVAAFCFHGLRVLVGARTSGLVIASAFVTIAPVIPMKHVSELYAYALLPLVAVTFGAEIAASVRSGPFARRAGAALIAVAVLSGNLVALRNDAQAMARNGERAAPLMRDLVNVVRQLPPGGRLLLVNPRTPLPEYSIFRMNTFRLTPENDVLGLAGRPDVAIAVVDSVGSASDRETFDACYSLDADVHLVPCSEALPHEP